MKKGVELSVNVIIIASIAIVVLIVLFAIFTGKMTEWVNAITGKKCTEIGGTPKPLQDGCGEGFAQTWAKKGNNTANGDILPSQICCVPRPSPTP